MRGVAVLDYVRLELAIALFSPVVLTYCRISLTLSLV